ncbi:endolytic transglycosylase MltG [Candidatus Microgenomates bacterium]|jgi:UPF0755 protein|nr:MAG: endolytic transglycosylase MltG [Candidatus Microgenomates bacterium]
MKILKAFLLLVFALLAGFSFWFYREFSGPAKEAQNQRFVISLDTKEEEVIERLYSEGFLKNKTIFNLILDFKGWRGKIEPGAYYLSKAMNAYELAGTLAYGPVQKWVVIPPGKRKEQTALILKKALNWPDDMTINFITVAEEGYLFPDTYLINTDATPEEVFKKLKGNFNEKFSAEIQQGLLLKNIRNDTAIKIASLIERESGGDSDKPIIAGIILNRIKKEMRLEIDATVQYALATENCSLSSKNTESHPLFECDFWPKLPSGLVRKVDSPFNTYRIDALPPAPICSPGLASIKAVAFPAETEAFYYLHSQDRQIHTAETYEEHKENIKEYLD